MTVSDHPTQPPPSPSPDVDSEVEDEEDEVTSEEGEESEGDGEDAEDYTTETFIGQRDSEDIEAEHAALKRQWEEMLIEDQNNKAELEEVREAVKRKYEEREEWKMQGKMDWRCR